jgi:hypothetical protein
MEQPRSLGFDKRMAGDGPWLEWDRPFDLEPGAADRRRPHSIGDLTSDGSGKRAMGSGYSVAIIDGEVKRKGPGGSGRMPSSYEPLRLEVSRPDGSIVSGRIGKPLSAIAAAVGPAGLLLEVEHIAGEHEIGQLATRRRNPTTCCHLGRDGVVIIQLQVRSRMPVGIRL